MEALDFSKVTALSIGGNNVTKLVIGGKVVWVKPSQFCYDYVDLGITDDYGNHICFATCNLGATKPTDFGWYLSWGELGTEKEIGTAKGFYAKGIKNNYDWDTYKYCEGAESTLTKYNNNASLGVVDNTYILENEDDAARFNLGENWRMPSSTEFQRLCYGVETWTWYADGNTEYNGVAGYKVTASNGNSIFLPLSGLYGGKELYSNQGAYLSRESVFGTNSAYFMALNPNGKSTGNITRVLGCSVRPVKVIIEYTFVDLGITDSEGNHVLFANKNLGAEKPTDVGWYIAWGELGTKEEGYVNGIKTAGYSNSTTKYYDSETQAYTKYNSTDGETALELTDDAVRANLSDTCRIPTMDEWQTLNNTTNFTWTWDDNNKGYIITSKINGYEGNSIFLPANGYRYGSSLEYDAYGFYWSSVLSKNSFKSAYGLYFYSESVERTGGDRRSGRGLRPVKVVPAS